MTLSLVDMYWVVLIDMYHSYFHYLIYNFKLGTMAEETKVKSKRPEARLDIKPDMGRNGRGNNQKLNQKLRNTTDKYFGRTTDKLVKRTKAIHGDIL